LPISTNRMMAVPVNVLEIEPIWKSPIRDIQRVVHVGHTQTRRAGFTVLQDAYDDTRHARSLHRLPDEFDQAIPIFFVFVFHLDPFDISLHDVFKRFNLYHAW
jgi:hypothetical protein